MVTLKTDNGDGTFTETNIPITSAHVSTDPVESDHPSIPDPFARRAWEPTGNDTTESRTPGDTRGLGYMPSPDWHATENQGFLIVSFFKAKIVLVWWSLFVGFLIGFGPSFALLVTVPFGLLYTCGFLLHLWIRSFDGFSDLFMGLFCYALRYSIPDFMAAELARTGKFTRSVLHWDIENKPCYTPTKWTWVMALVWLWRYVSLIALCMTIYRIILRALNAYRVSGKKMDVVDVNGHKVGETDVTLEVAPQVYLDTAELLAALASAFALFASFTPLSVKLAPLVIRMVRAMLRLLTRMPDAPTDDGRIFGGTVASFNEAFVASDDLREEVNREIETHWDKMKKFTQAHKLGIFLGVCFVALVFGFFGVLAYYRRKGFAVVKAMECTTPIVDLTTKEIEQQLKVEPVSKEAAVIQIVSAPNVTDVVVESIPTSEFGMAVAQEHKATELRELKYQMNSIAQTLLELRASVDKQTMNKKVTFEAGHKGRRAARALDENDLSKVGDVDAFAAVDEDFEEFMKRDARNWADMTPPESVASEYSDYEDDQSGYFEPDAVSEMVSQSSTATHVTTPSEIDKKKVRLRRKEATPQRIEVTRRKRDTWYSACERARQQHGENVVLWFTNYKGEVVEDFDKRPRPEPKHHSKNSVVAGQKVTVEAVKAPKGKLKKTLERHPNAVMPEKVEKPVNKPVKNIEREFVNNKTFSVATDNDGICPLVCGPNLGMGVRWGSNMILTMDHVVGSLSEIDDSIKGKDEIHVEWEYGDEKFIFSPIDRVGPFVVLQHQRGKTDLPKTKSLAFANPELAQSIVAAKIQHPGSDRRLWTMGVGQIRSVSERHFENHAPTVGGFSGTPYLQNGKVVGLHEGFNNKANLGIRIPNALFKKYNMPIKGTDYDFRGYPEPEISDIPSDPNSPSPVGST